MNWRRELTPSGYWLSRDQSAGGDQPETNRRLRNVRTRVVTSTRTRTAIPQCVTVGIPRQASDLQFSVQQSPGTTLPSSQFSPGSTALFPQMGAQSLSMLALQCPSGGQQPSPSMQSMLPSWGGQPLL